MYSLNDTALESNPYIKINFDGDGLSSNAGLPFDQRIIFDIMKIIASGRADILINNSKLGENLIMAMIQCPECGKDISDKAYICPHCGYPVKPFPVYDEEYQLHLSQISGSSGFSIFLKIMAIILWTGGTSLAYALSRIPNYLGIYELSITQFFTIVIPYVINGIIF